MGGLGAGESRAVSQSIFQKSQGEVRKKELFRGGVIYTEFCVNHITLEVPLRHNCRYTLSCWRSEIGA